MADRRDPFEALARPVAPFAPRPAFAAALRRRLLEELDMTSTDDTPTATPTGEDGQLVMVHLRVADADRAGVFFGVLFSWETERVPFDDHVSHYTVNTDVTVRLRDDPGAPPVIPNYRVGDVAATIRAVKAAGGTISASDPEPDGGGWAQGTDDQGLPLLVYRPGRYHEHAPPSRRPTGQVGLVFVREDLPRARAFYGSLFGWALQPEYPGSHYANAVPRVGVFDEAAVSGEPVPVSATLFLEVDALEPALARVAEVGGVAGEVDHTMGPYVSAVCTDDQGTVFGLLSSRLEAE
jgi:predicted enzyme related to lactoylglutathione lyase